MARALSDYYPPNPTDLPPRLTTPSAGYRLQALVVLLSLGLFLLVYLALIAGSLYGAYKLFALIGQLPAGGGRGNSRGNGWAVFALIAGGLSCAGVALFLVKGFFKRNRSEDGPRLEVTAEEQPLLFAFLRKLTHDTGAPYPHRVYLSPDVNAAVFYHESLLSLIVPGRKNLLIGLGLVNRLDLAEFKAVLAHEFGHFAQSSMALGRYVYSANKAIADVVYGRDALDHAVEQLKHIDIRLSVFVWVFAGVLWVLRQGLALLFRTITFANTSLSRQMEFNADRVAVSVAGSDAIVHALARLDLASEALGQACGELAQAADHNLYSTDVYYHQTRAAEQIKRAKHDPTLGEVPPLPADPEETTRVFDPEDTSVPRMWATHPSNHDREASAKEFYVRSPADPRPAWTLFRDVPAVKEAMTRKMYGGGDKKPKRGAEWKSPEEVQAFIDQENEASTYDPRYHGLYDDRYIKAGLAEDILQDAPDYSPDELAGHAFLYDDELAERMMTHKKRQEEMGRLVGLASGQVEAKGTHFTHRGKEYKPKPTPSGWPRRWARRSTPTSSGCTSTTARRSGCTPAWPTGSARVCGTSWPTATASTSPCKTCTWGW